MYYFFDTYALFEILSGNRNYEKYKEFPIILSVLNVAELYWNLLKEKDRKTADEEIEKFNFETLNIGYSLIIDAVLFRYENKRHDISLVDAVGYLLAKKHKLKFLTGDKFFENRDQVEFVK